MSDHRQTVVEVDEEVGQAVDRDREVDLNRSGHVDGRFAVPAMLVGVGLIVASDRIARVLARLLPWRAEVSSRGSNFPPFSEVAPAIIERTGIAILIVVAAMVAAQRVGGERVEWSPRVRIVAVGGVASVSALWYGWLSTPHNAYPSNARFHWVDYLTWDSDNFFYAAGRLPHMLFYEHPFVWQAINVAILVVLLGLFAIRIGLDAGETILFTLAPAYSSNLLLFADTSEDVLLNSTLLVGAAVAATYRRPFLLGLALALVVLGRPSFLVIVPCAVIADYLVALARTRRPLAAVRRLDVRYHTIAIGVFLLATVAAQTLFTLIGDRYLVVGGRLIETGSLATQVPIEVDGFTISAFSGVFTLHLLWMLPLVVLAGAGAAVFRSPRYSDDIAASVYFLVIAAVAIVALHESRPQNYYNFRYITYAWPLLLLAAWVVVARSRSSPGSAMRVGAVAALVVGSMVVPADPISVKRTVEERRETELAGLAEGLRDLAEGRSIGVTFGAKSTTNYLAYIFKTERARIELLQAAPTAGDYVVITQREDPIRGAEPVLETESLLVYVTPP